MEECKMKIDYLANHQDLIPTVAQWYFDIWGKISKNSSLERTETKLRERLNTRISNIRYTRYNISTEFN
jgi:hypothetical protein